VSESSYFPNGKLEMKGGFAGGEMDGTWSWFNPDGSPSKTIVYAHGHATEAWRYRKGHKEPVPPDEIDLEP
jgi:antitoxin component YwqK of YwqJK toxin-antitoxin module